jgi:ubiquinone/menaquinone biosynthesis C-methylase UbiE
MDSDIYRLQPKKIVEVSDGRYSVFSETDDYVKNYEKISADHLSVFERDGTNPFMAEDFWNECEEITANLVRNYTSQGGTLLDVGCGMGRLLGRLPNYQRYGMDISSPYLSYAIKVGAEVCLAKVEDMPYRDQFFDTVVCTDVLEHVLDLNAAILQLFRVVKHGGHLVIRVPYRENLEPYLRPEYPYHMAHLRNFDEYSLRILFEKIFNGKVVDEVRGPYLEQGGYFKWPIQMRGLGFAVRNTLRISSLVSRGLRQRIVRTIFRPVEISIVIRKL